MGERIIKHKPNWTGMKAGLPCDTGWFVACIFDTNNAGSSWKSVHFFLGRDGLHLGSIPQGIRHFSRLRIRGLRVFEGHPGPVCYAWASQPPKAALCMQVCLQIVLLLNIVKKTVSVCCQTNVSRCKPCGGSHRYPGRT